MVDRRHEHQKATRQRHVGRDAGALGAQRFLDDLDQDLLALFEQVLDLGLGFPLAIAVLAAGTIAPIVVRLARVGLASRRRSLVLVLGRELLERIEDLGHVEKSVSLETDINEGRLHAGQDCRDPAFVDVADHAALPLALDENFRDQIVLEDGHPRFVAGRGDHHLLVHASNSKLGRRPGGRMPEPRTRSCTEPLGRSRPASASSCLVRPSGSSRASCHHSRAPARVSPSWRDPADANTD